jgi:hypothetical protein
MRPNPSKTWPRDQCGGVVIDYGKYNIKNGFKNFDEGCHYCLG